jgi:hypothetical protein
VIAVEEAKRKDLIITIKSRVRKSSCNPHKTQERSHKVLSIGPVSTKCEVIIPRYSLHFLQTANYCPDSVDVVSSWLLRSRISVRLVEMATVAKP